jgi:polyribonucleotide nucleotidyltransferase
MVGASYDNIMMVEGEMNEVSEEEMLEPLNLHTKKLKNIARYRKNLLLNWVW